MAQGNKKFAIMRIGKITGRSVVRNALKHNLRQLKNDSANIDPTRSHKNVHNPRLADYDTCKNRFEVNLSKTGKIRKNAVMLHEIVITASPEQVSNMTHKELIAYFNDAMIWGNKLHGGAQNLVGMSLHYDESNPHCHMLYTPVEAVGDKFKLNSRGILGNIEQRRHPTPNELKENAQAIADARSKIDCGDKNIKIPKTLVPGKNNVFILQRSESRLSDYQSSFYEEVGKKHGLDRGIKKSLTKAKHTPIKEYHSELIKKVDALEVDLNNLRVNYSERQNDYDYMLEKLARVNTKLETMSQQYLSMRSSKNTLESDIERLTGLQQNARNQTIGVLKAQIEQIEQIEQDQDYRPSMRR
jgi:hypothetical protein